MNAILLRVPREAAAQEEFTNATTGRFIAQRLTQPSAKAVLWAVYGAIIDGNISQITHKAYRGECDW